MKVGEEIKKKKKRGKPADAIAALQTPDALKEYGFSISSSEGSCSTRLAVPERSAGCQSMHTRRFVCKQNKQPLLNSCNQLSNNSPLRIQHRPAAYLILNPCFLSWLSMFKSSLRSKRRMRADSLDILVKRQIKALQRSSALKSDFNTNELLPPNLQTLIHGSSHAKSTQTAYLQGSPPAWTGLQAKGTPNLEDDHGLSLVCIPVLSCSVMLSRCISNVPPPLMERRKEKSQK